MRKITVDFPQADVDRMMRMVADSRLPDDEALDGDDFVKTDDQQGFTWGITRAQLAELKHHFESNWSWERTKEWMNK